MYCYDKNGNMTSRGGSTISWYSYNQPNSITSGSNSTQFNYDANRQRWKQVAVDTGSTTTTYYVGGILEKVIRPTGVTEYRHAIPAGSGTAIYTRRSNATNSTYYVTTDHLGSGDLVLDSAGAVLARESFTPFGERRGSNWQGLPSAGDKAVFADVTRRGFTGHEMLDAVNLIHMNGRVYDPHLGRFLSADPIIQTISLSQALNPFSYVMNNPLTLIDPSGYSWLSSLFRSVGHFLKKWGGLIIGVVLAFNGVPFLLNSLISSAFSTAVNGGTFGSFLVGFGVGLAAGMIAGPIGAKLGSALGITGQKLGAQIFMGALTGGLAGGISSVAMGGSFWSGFAGGALGGALSTAATYGLKNLSGSQDKPVEQQPNSGGKGNPDEQFTKDANGNLVYSDEVSGPFSDNSELTVTSEYHSSRDGGTTYHSGLDLAPPNGVTDANAISGNTGTVARISATGFGPNAVVIQTPKGNWVTYGHLASTTMKVGMAVSPGTVIGVIGNLGLSTGIHLHVQVTTGAMFGSQSRFLGVHGPYCMKSILIG